MKLFVFLVNTGATLTFDTELALQTVAELRQAIHTKYRIGVQHQVLVVSGGECLAGERRVCSYSAGTDTNPIFLFSKELILHDRAPCVSRVVLPGEAQMEPKVEESVIMPAVFHTVTLRTQLALEMQELAQRLCMVCESLVHDEHMQHQGWAAVTANLDDCSSAFAGLLTAFTRAYAAFMESRRDILAQLSECVDRSLTHSFTHSLTHSFTSFVHSFIHSFIHSLGRTRTTFLDSCRVVILSPASLSPPLSPRPSLPAPLTPSLSPRPSHPVPLSPSLSPRPSLPVPLSPPLNSTCPNSLGKATWGIFVFVWTEQWASLLVRDGKELYQAERERREAFRQIFGHSFLKGRLFQGLESWPPSSFCTREPRAFDEQLPAVTLEDLHFLQSHSPPEMQPYLQLPTLCDFELLREHSARGRRLARAVRGAQDASLALAQLLSTKTLVGRSDGRGEAGSWEGESPASPDRPGSLLLLSPPSHGDTGDPGREDAGAHGGSDGDPLTRDNRDLSPDSIDSQVFDFETINHPAAETHPPLSSTASTAAAASAATSTVTATAQAISPRSAGLLQSPGAVVESLYASVINAIDSQRRMRREGGDGDGDGDGGDGAMGDSRLSSPHPDSWSSPSNRSDVRSRSAVARGRGCAAAFTALRASTAGVRRELAGLGEQVRSDGRQLAGLLADARRHLEEALPAHRESSSDSTSEANDVERRPLADPSHHLAQLQQQQREEEEEEVRVRGLDAELTCEAERVRGLEVQLAQEAERRSDLETELAEGAERCQGLRVELAQEAQRRNSQQVLLAQQAERKMSLEVELTQEAEKHRGLAAELTQETERRVGLEKELARETERRMSLETDLVQETGRRVGWEMELTQQAEKRVTLEKELVVESERRHFLESELAQEAERRVGLETELAEEAERRVGLETELAEDAGKRMGLEKELAREAERRVGLETELVQEAERRVGLETELALEAQKRRALETKLSDESKKTVGLEAQLAEETARSQGLTAELIQEAESHQALDTKLAEEAQKRTGLMVELARETERRRNLEAELVQEAETRVSLETELTQEAERWRGLAAGLAQETNRRILLEADLAHEVKAHRELVAALADETERRHELQAELADRAAEREASLHGLAALLEHERELAVAELLSCHEAEVARLTAELRQAETRVQRLEEQGEEAGGLTVELQEGVLDVEWRSREASRGRRREKPVGVALKTAGSEAGHHQQQHQQQQHQQHQQQQHQQHQQQQQGLTIAAERGLKTGASSEPQGPAGGERLIKGKVITELGEKLQRLLEQHDRDKEAIEKLLSEKTFLEETVARLKGTHDLAAASPSSPNVAEARAQQPPPLQPPTQPTQPTQPLQPRGWLRARGSSVGHGTSAVAGQPGLLQAVAWGLTSGVLGAGEAREGRKEPSGGGGGGAGGGAGVLSAAMPLERTRTPLLFLPVECGDSVGGDGGGGDGAAMAMAGDGLDASVVALRENAPSEDKQRVLMLEKALHQKEKEHSRLVQRLMSQSVAPVSPRQPEKLAIKDFQVGDLVLIILDERHDNYVVFTVGPTLYFLHAESLPPLELRPGQCGPGPRRTPHRTAPRATADSGGQLVA
ncbi:uncharacterized protein LOC144726506 [Lampetra planeri]